MNEISENIFDTPDRVVWTGRPSGILSAKDYWLYSRQHHPNIAALKHVWYKWMPPKIAICAWRVFYKAYPTDDMVTKCGIEMASKCVCCHHPSQESITHLFVKGEWAQAAWRFLNIIFYKVMPRSNS
ncbi:hypothetical protein QQ045_021438 [Rhodiola kirilowii]